MYLEKINSPADLKELSVEEMTALAAEMREALIVRASRHMGHVGPDLGFIEATIALHAVFSSPEDKIIYDISHQTYPHKMLTGRKEAYTDPAHYDDVSAYSNPKESPHDFFELGHTSVSIDLALGMAKARELLGGTEKVIAVIGDGSLSGGEALEGLNTAGEFKGQFLILVNDNQMSIAENHGGLYASLKALRESNGTSENNLFRAMGLDYRYEAAGNDIGALIRALNAVKDLDHPVVLHINTLKGKGYGPAETRKEEFHWHFPFDRESGEILPDFRFEGESYEEATADFLLQAAAEDPAVLVLTSGVPGTVDLTPERYARRAVSRCRHCGADGARHRLGRGKARGKAGLFYGGNFLTARLRPRYLHPEEPGHDAARQRLALRYERCDAQRRTGAPHALQYPGTHCTRTDLGRRVPEHAPLVPEAERKSGRNPHSLHRTLPRDGSGTGELFAARAL